MSDYYEPTVDPYLQDIEKKKVNTALTKMPEPYLSGLKLNADVQINGLTLNTIDSNNVVWVLSDLEGWWNLPDSELPDLPRGWGDGSYDAIGRWANRIITLNGSFLPQRPEDAPAARQALMNAIALVKTGGWLVVQEDPTPGANPRAAYVRLSGTPQISSANARGRHDFSIGLKAVDPIKYEYVDGAPDGYKSVTLSVNNTNYPINNIGNTPVPIIIELSAGFNAPAAPNYARIWNSTTDETITIVGDMDPDVRLEIDTYNREVLEVDYSTVVNPEDEPGVLNGRSKVSVLIDWIYLKPGINNLRIVDFPSGSSCTIYYRSGWLA